jgi:subfamily B ATP-binding cassette protein MsbA
MSAQPHFLQRLVTCIRLFKNPSYGWVTAVICMVLVALCEPMVPALLQPLLDKGFQQNSFSIWLVPFALIGLFGIRGMGMFVGQVAISKITQTGLLALRMQMFNRLQDAALPLYRQQNASALGNTLVFEVQVGAQTLVNSVIGTVRDSLTLVALIGYLLYLNWQLSLIVALLIPSVAWLMKVLSRRLYALIKHSQQATDQLSYAVEETALAHREIRLHEAQAMQAQRFEGLGKAMARLAVKTSVASAGITPLTQLFSAVALSAVISVALLQSQGSQMSVGGFDAFVTGMLMLVNPIKHLSEVAGPITRGIAALERALELIHTTPVESSGKHTSKRAKGHLQLRQVSVQYQADLPYALDKIDLEIQPGETVALVGSSGSGKTSLANLLPRFVDLTHGEILLDGVLLHDWELLHLRRQFAMVSQTVVVLNDTLAANVALGQIPDRDKVVECLLAANLGDYLNNLPQHIDTLVGHNASSLSGGQRQRLAIARALYKDAPFLILDEATSALDNESERMVQEALQKLQVGRTTLVIAHRLSTIENADRIVVMDAGKIIETGNHTQLMQVNGVYASMYRLGNSGHLASSL